MTNDFDYSVSVKGGSGWDSYPMVRLMISVGQDYHEGEKLKALVEWINKNPSIQSVHVSINDYLQRHNLLGDQYSKEEASRISLGAGKQWRKRNEEILSRIEPRVYFTRWKTWLEKPEFKQAHDAILRIFKRDKKFQECIYQDAMAYIKRRKDLDLNIFHTMIFHCTDYLLEELAVFALQCHTLPSAEIYPGRNLISADYLTRKGNQLPEVLKPLAQRYFTRIDFDRVEQLAPSGKRNLALLRLDQQKPSKPEIFIHDIKTWVGDPDQIARQLDTGQDGLHKGAFGIKLEKKQVPVDSLGSASPESGPIVLKIFSNKTPQTLWALARASNLSPTMRLVNNMCLSLGKDVKQDRLSYSLDTTMDTIDANPYAEKPPTNSLIEAITKRLSDDSENSAAFTFPALDNTGAADQPLQGMSSIIPCIIDRDLKKNGFPKVVRDNVVHHFVKLPEWHDEAKTPIAGVTLLKAYFPEDVSLLFYGDRFHVLDPNCFALVDDRLFKITKGEPSQINMDKIIIEVLNANPVFLFNDHPSEPMAFVNIKEGTLLSVNRLFEFSPDFVQDCIENAGGIIKETRIDGPIVQHSLAAPTPTGYERTPFAPIKTTFTAVQSRTLSDGG
jgi:tRNA-dependent cyclodipeptide synthase